MGECGRKFRSSKERLLLGAIKVREELQFQNVINGKLMGKQLQKMESINKKLLS